MTIEFTPSEYVEYFLNGWYRFFSNSSNKEISSPIFTQLKCFTNWLFTAKQIINLLIINLYIRAA